MAVIFTITLIAMLAFASLYAGTRANLMNLREDLDEAYRKRDDAILGRQAAEAKAEQLAATVHALTEVVDMPAADVYLLGLEAELDGEVHGLAAILSANDIAEEQA